MPELVYVAVPGPWWTNMVYSYSETLTPGVRVSVPLGTSVRTGVVVPPPEEPEKLSGLGIKPVSAVIDDKPVIPEDITKTIYWFSRVWFTGLGLSYKIFLPSAFFKDEKLGCYETPSSDTPDFGVEYVYDVNDLCRYEKYREIITSAEHSVLLLFPEQSKVKKFWEFLPEDLKMQGVLWPATQPAKQWKMWKSLLDEQPRFIVGSQNASFLPFRKLSAVIFDEEASRAWYTQKSPVFHYRSVVGMRAKFAGATFVLGGPLPSAKSCLQSELYISESASGKCTDRLVFVDRHNSSLFDVNAVKDPIPISKPLKRETCCAGEKKKWALWVFDRKGYAGEIYCQDCGSVVTCDFCGGTMRWKSQSGTLVCPNCSKKISVPERCPSCGGAFLEGSHPGLEALAEKAGNHFLYGYRDVILFENDGEKIPSAEELRGKYPDGALIIGTRRILSFLDGLEVGMVGWIDADAEARSSEYDARFRAFSLIYESIWRGTAPDERRVVIQSRRPSRNWQSSLSRGWNDFWKNELKERELWELPPFLPMIKINVPANALKMFLQGLDDEFFDYWQSEDNKCEIWIRTKKFSKLYSILEPFYSIRRARTGFPQVTLYLD